jgi:hypothetical protein
MFSWMLVISELVILAAAFWFIFLRDEHSRSTRVESDIWGSYDHEHKEADLVLVFSDRFPKGVKAEPRAAGKNGTQQRNVVPFQCPSSKKPA